MKKFHYHYAVMAVTALVLSACGSDDDLSAVIEEPNTLSASTTISITATYGSTAPSTENANGPRRIGYIENGKTISGTWEEGDEIYVVCEDGSTTLTLKNGDGKDENGNYGVTTNTACFVGELPNVLTDETELTFYVRDKRNPDAVTISTTKNAKGTYYEYQTGAFSYQDGTMESAAKVNFYTSDPEETYTYGSLKTNPTVNFVTNTSMLKFNITGPGFANGEGAKEGDQATLSYVSSGTELAKATFTVGTNKTNLIYMTVPAGEYTGLQKVTYKVANTSGTPSGDTPWRIVDMDHRLSATKATFDVGKTYTISISEWQERDEDRNDPVDLGLSVSVKWAAKNVGASKSTDYGLFFAWGETTGYGSDGHSFNWDSYGYKSGVEYLWNHSSNEPIRYTKPGGELGTDDDAAVKKWGSDWRMPSKDELQELINETTHGWTSKNGVCGMLFIGSTGYSIFLPAAGNRHDDALESPGTLGVYWSRTLSSNNKSGCRLLFTSSFIDIATSSRYYARSVRPVYPK